MTNKTARISIVCIIVIFIFSCCGIVLGHKARDFRRDHSLSNKPQHSSQMFNKGEEFRKGPMNKPFIRPDGDRPGFGPMMRGPRFMGGDRPNLTKEEICKTCPICNGKGSAMPRFFGDKREGPKSPDFKVGPRFGEKQELPKDPNQKIEPKKEENKNLEKPEK